MTSLFKKLKSPSFIFFSCVLVVTVIIAILSHSYFTERVFYINQDKYTFDSEQGKLISYHSGTATPVQVRIEDQERKVLINNMEYAIARIDSPFEAKYSVSYPNGRKYEVQDLSGTLISFDEKGVPVSEIFLYANGQRVTSEGEETYTPATLVTAAYPEYHFTLGAPGFLFLALAGMIYGWCGYRYRKFQDIMFFLSLHWLWVEDPEPSDFYYFMCKLGGIVVMIGAVFIAFKAF
jgi:hypothetical protein